MLSAPNRVVLPTSQSITYVLQQFLRLMGVDVMDVLCRTVMCGVDQTLAEGSTCIRNAVRSQEVFTKCVGMIHGIRTECLPKEIPAIQQDTLPRTFPCPAVQCSAPPSPATQPSSELCLNRGVVRLRVWLQASWARVLVLVLPSVQVYHCLYSDFLCGGMLFSVVLLLKNDAVDPAAVVNGMELMR